MLVYSLQAAPVTPQEALSRVETHTINKSKALKPAANITLQRTIDAADGLPAVYIFGNSTQWMFISADDLAKPVLGFLDNAPAADATMPGQLETWLTQISEDIMTARANTSSSVVQLSKAASTTTSKASIAPLLTTTWAQSTPYNNDCPVLGSNGERALTGCVATAMSQIIYHNRYPQASVGTGTASDGSTMDLNITYDYDNMLDSYTTDNYTDEQASAMSKLLAACGYSAQMKYGLTGSGTSSQYAAAAFKNNFLYPNVEYVRSNLCSKAKWGEMIYDNLSHGYPILYSATARDYGHAFVLDGYEYAYGNDYYHFNWGWSGYQNGYFLIDYLLPAGDFHKRQDMIINIVPDTDSYYYEVTPFPYINEISLDETGVVKWTVFGPVVATGTFTIAYSVENINDATDNFSIPLYSDLEFSEGGGYIFKFNLSDSYASKLTAGQTYKITPVYRTTTDEAFTAIPYDNTTNRGYFLATVADGDAGITYTIPSLTMPEVKLNELASPIYINDKGAVANVALTGTITNNSTEELHQMIRPVLLQRTDSALSIVGEGLSYLVWMQPGESKELSLTTDFASTTDIAAGDYEIAFEPYDYDFTVSECIPAVINEFPGYGTLEVNTFTTGYTDEEVPANDIAFDIEMTCKDGLYNYYTIVSISTYEYSNGTFTPVENYYYSYLLNLIPNQTLKFRQEFNCPKAEAGMTYVASLTTYTYENGKYSQNTAAKIQSTFSDGEVTTGIADITPDATAPDVNLPVYDLTGRMVAPHLANAQLPAGIYIVGNKKVSIR
jgi:hypothetical protein